MPGALYPADYSATYSGPQFTATQGRTAFAAAMGGATTARPLGGFSGVRPGTPTTIATATTTTYTVTPFGGYIDLATLATNGGYFFSFQANQTGTVTAAVASARVDLLYVQANDVNTSDGSAMAPQSIVGYQAGVGGSGVPTLTAARAFVIAQINVPASGGGSPTVTWVAPYCVAAGGILPVPTTVYPASPYIGQYVDDAVLGLLRYNGSGWMSIISDSGTTVPALALSWVAVGSGFAAPSYRMRGGLVSLFGTMKSGSAGTIFTLPVGMRPLAIRRFLVDSLASTATIDISAGGAVGVSQYGSGGNNTTVGLDGINFFAEQ